MHIQSPIVSVKRFPNLPSHRQEISSNFPQSKISFYSDIFKDIPSLCPVLSELIMSKCLNSFLHFLKVMDKALLRSVRYPPQTLGV